MHRMNQAFCKSIPSEKTESIRTSKLLKIVDIRKLNKYTFRTKFCAQISNQSISSEKFLHALGVRL